MQNASNTCSASQEMNSLIRGQYQHVCSVNDGFVKDDCVEALMRADGTALLSDSGRSRYHHSGKKRFFSDQRQKMGAGVLKVAALQMRCWNIEEPGEEWRQALIELAVFPRINSRSRRPARGQSQILDIITWFKWAFISQMRLVLNAYWPRYECALYSLFNQ